MANPEHLKIVKQGVDVWNRWRDGAPPSLEPDLMGADLRDLNLSNVNLSDTLLIRADLYGANLREANLEEAVVVEAMLVNVNFHYANVSDADFAGAVLIRSDFSDANVENTVFLEANLIGVNFSDAKLSGCNFDRALLDNTIFANVDLSSVEGLENCRHSGPSTIDYRTLVKYGSLPIEFLRGCGLPDFIIENVTGVSQVAISFYSCFISYSHMDEDFAQRIYSDLQERGVRCWYAPEDLKSGKKLYQQVSEAIGSHDKLLLLLSEHSMNSQWVQTELRNARKRERQERKHLLFPISLIDFERIKDWELFDADEGRDLAAEVREYFIPDFSNWRTDQDAYKKAFERLLRDLRAKDQPNRQ